MALSWEVWLALNYTLGVQEARKETSCRIVNLDTTASLSPLELYKQLLKFSAKSTNVNTRNLLF